MQSQLRLQIAGNKTEEFQLYIVKFVKHIWFKNLEGVAQ